MMVHNAPGNDVFAVTSSLYSTPADTNLTNFTGDAKGLTSGEISIVVFSTLINLVTFFGNLIVLFAFLTTPKLRTYSNYYVVSLAVSDLIAGGITMPVYSVYWVLGEWPFSDTFCDVYLYVNHVFIHISIVTIVVIAYDRWQAVTMPLKHLEKRHITHAMLLITISYVIPILVWLPGCLLWPYMSGERTISEGQCYPQYIDSLVFSCFAPIILFWFPLCIALVLYWKVIKVIRRTRMTRKRYKISYITMSMGRLYGNSLSSSSVKDPRNVTASTAEQRNGSISSNDILELEESKTCPRRMSGASTNVVGVDNLGITERENDNAECNNTLVRQTQEQDTMERSKSLNGTLGRSTDSLMKQPRGGRAGHKENNMGRIKDSVMPRRQPGGGKEHSDSLLGKFKESMRRENIFATNTLTLTFIAMIVASVPWSTLVPIQSACPTCMPRQLYQVNFGKIQY